MGKTKQILFLWSKFTQLIFQTYIVLQRLKNILFILGFHHFNTFFDRFDSGLMFYFGKINVGIHLIIRKKTVSSLPTFLADLAGKHAVALTCPPAHPGLVKDAFLPSFDQLQKVQV